MPHLVILGLPLPGRQYMQPGLARRLHQSLVTLGLQEPVQDSGDCDRVREDGLPRIKIKQDKIRPVQVGEACKPHMELVYLGYEIE